MLHGSWEDSMGYHISLLGSQFAAIGLIELPPPLVIRRVLDQLAIVIDVVAPPSRTALAQCNLRGMDPRSGIGKVVGITGRQRGFYRSPR